MLKSPYEYIYQVGYNKYYYLTLSDMPYSFLGIESTEEVHTIKKRFLRKPKEITNNIVVSHKMLPLSALTLFLIYNANMSRPITYTLDVNDKKIDIYGTWDEYDIETLRKTFKHAVVDVAGISNYDFSHTIHNLVARGFDKDGYNFIGVETSGKLSRTYWLVRTSQYGGLSFVAINESGTDSNSLTTAVNVILLDRHLIAMITEDFMSKKFTKDLSEEDVLNIQDLIEKGEQINGD